MRASWSTSVLALFLLCSAVASADDDAPAPAANQSDEPDATAKADALVEEGNQLGEKGNYEGALEKWREADRWVRRPLHACNIGLAYVRLAALRPGYWAQAHYYLSRCQSSWTDGLPPSWVDRRIAESLTALTRGSFAKVSVTVTPDDAEWTISFLENERERFKGRRDFWVPHGQHLVVAGHPQHGQTSKPIIVRDNNAQAVVIEVVKKPTPPPPLVDPRRSPETTAGSRPDSVVVAPEASPPPLGRKWLYAGIGTSAGAVGLTVLAFVFRSKANDAAKEARDEAAASSRSKERFDGHVDDINANNTFFAASLIGGAVAAGISGFFYYKWLSASPAGSDTKSLVASEDGREQPPVAVAPIRGGVAASLSWTF